MRRPYPLLTLGRLQALTTRENYLLVAASSKVKKGIFQVEIPDDALVATNNSERKLLEQKQRSRKNGIVWHAAGAGILLNLADCQVLLAVHRDSGAPVYPDLDTIGSGMAGSQAEFYYPLQTVVREAFEEFLILTPGGAVSPQLEGDPFGFSMTIQDVVLEGMRHQADLMKKLLVSARARLLELAGETEIRIRHLGRTWHCSAVICIDPGGCRVDLMKVVEIDLPWQLSQLQIYDGELGSQGQPLGRLIKAYETSAGVPSGRLLGEWRHGEFQAESKACKFTPNGQVLYDALSATAG